MSTSKCKKSSLSIGLTSADFSLPGSGGGYRRVKFVYCVLPFLRCSAILGVYLGGRPTGPRSCASTDKPGDFLSLPH